MATHAAKPFKTGLKQIFLYVAMRLGEGNDIICISNPPLCPGLNML